MSFHLISDLHLEVNPGRQFKELLPHDTADLLFIAGDCGNPFQPEYEAFLEYVSPKYQHIFIIAGNHEYYSGLEMAKVENEIKSICCKFDNIHFLQKNCYEIVINNTKWLVLGCTLWSHLINNTELISHYLNDFNMIHNFSTNLYNFIHKDHLKWLLDTLEYYKDHTNIIVMTHHLPTPQLVHERYLGHFLNDAFTTDLDYVIHNYTNIKWWFCGHSHISHMTTIGKTMCLINSVGHPHEKSGWIRYQFEL